MEKQELKTLINNAHSIVFIVFFLLRISFFNIVQFKDSSSKKNLLLEGFFVFVYLHIN